MDPPSCLPPPSAALCIFVIQIQDAYAASDAAIAPLWSWQSSDRCPFCCHCQTLSSHSCPCQPLISFTASIYGWLLRPPLIHRLLPAPLSAAPIIDAFVAGRCAVLFLICAVIILIAPLPSSIVVIPPTNAFKPCTLLSCSSCSLVWSSLIHPAGWLLHHISSRHRLLSAFASTCSLVATTCCPP